MPGIQLLITGSAALWLFLAGACARQATIEPVARRLSADRVLVEEIDAMLARSAISWNAGNLDAFMLDFEEGREATFVVPRGVLRGRDEIRTAYSSRFAAGAERDSLTFEQLEVHPLGADLAYVIAFYVLKRGDSTTARGPTTLVMRRQHGRWRILHDHSS
jgi:uncharacterized protein (TIGR02246 family)